MNHIYLTLLFSTLTTICFADGRLFTSVEQLSNSGILSTRIIGKGGYSGDVVQFCLQNNSSDSAFVWIEPGRRLKSHDAGEQDLLILREELVRMAPNSVDTIDAFGFCCQASNSSPSRGSEFDVGQMAPKKWVKFAQFVSGLGIASYILQKAVWVFSNKHDIRSIPATQDVSVRKMRKKVADILGIELPWYSFKYAQSEDTTQLFSGDRTHIFAEVDFKVPYRTMVTGQVHDQTGKLIHQTPSYHASRGENVFTFETSIEHWPVGKYTFSLMEDFHTLNQSRMINLDSHEEENEGGDEEQEENPTHRGDIDYYDGRG